MADAAIECLRSLAMTGGWECMSTGLQDGSGLKEHSPGSWKAWTLVTTMARLRTASGRFPAVMSIPADCQLPLASKPLRSVYDTVVIGGGQAGLATAAQLENLGLSTLVVERNARIGDNWRLRYRMLSLNTTKAYSTSPDPSHI